MKKIYMTPEMEEIEIKNNMSLLAGSVGGSGDADDLGWGGEDPGVEPGVPGLPGMPDFGPGSVLGFPF